MVETQKSSPQILDHNGESDSALQALFFVIIALLLGVFTKSALAWTRVPFTALLLVWGVLLGIGNETYIRSWMYVGSGVSVWEVIEPNFFLSLLLPIIIYSSAVSMHWHTLRRCIVQVLLLAGPGVVIGTALTAVFVKYGFPYEWSWPQSLLFGAMLSATDPVAVIALLQEVGAEKELRTVIEGESLVNDGSAYVLFLLFRNALDGAELTPKLVVKQLCQLSLGGPAVGLAFGIVMVIWLRFIYNHDVVEVTMTIVAALGSFIVGNEILGVSGVLAVLTLGFWMVAFGEHHISRQVKDPLEIVWEELEFIANTLIFILAGVIIAGNIYESENSPDPAYPIRGRDYGYAVLLWLALLAVRAIIVLVAYPLLKFTGYGITFRKALVIVWAGLRGAVGLALSLFVLFDNQIHDSAFRLLAFFFMGLIAALTILVQGTTTGLLLQKLGLTRRATAKRTFLNNVLQQIEHYGDDHARMVNPSEVLTPANWHDISSLASLNGISLLTRYASMHSIRPAFLRWPVASSPDLEASAATMTAEKKSAQMRQETRARLLRAVQQTYEDIFERAHVAPAHMYKLKDSANRALDHTAEALSDFKFLEENLSLPAWLRLLHRVKGLPLLLHWRRKQLFNSLEHSALLMVAFHYAHVDAAQSMKHFDLQLGRAEGAGTSETSDEAKIRIIQEVIEESQSELERVEQHLQTLRAAYPEVLASVRTKQVAQEMLLVKEQYVHELKASGLMVEAEVEEVIGLVERQKKRLHYAGSRIHIPPASAELRQMSLFQGLLDDTFAQVLRSAQLQLIAPGQPVYGPRNQGTVAVVIRGGIHISQAMSSHPASLQDSPPVDGGQTLTELSPAQQRGSAGDHPVGKAQQATGCPSQDDGPAEQAGALQLCGVTHDTFHSNGAPASSGISRQQPRAVQARPWPESSNGGPTCNGDKPAQQSQTGSSVPNGVEMSDTKSSTEPRGSIVAPDGPEMPALEARAESRTGNQRPQQQAGHIMDGRGCTLGLDEVLHQMPTSEAQGVAATAQTDVEAYFMPVGVVQRLIAEGPLVKLRALQLWAAHMMLLDNASGLRDLSWQDLQQTFRKAKLQRIEMHQSLKLEGPTYLLSGQLQSGPLHSASSRKPCPADKVWTGPAFLEHVACEAVCLQDAQVLHLPKAAVGSAQQSHSEAPAGAGSLIGLHDSAAASRSMQTSAEDTGHWGKGLHDASPFLQHDLWSKLGRQPSVAT